MEARQYIQGVNYQTYKDPQRFSMHTWVAIYVQGQKKRGKWKEIWIERYRTNKKKERGEKKGGKRKEIVQKKYVIIFSRRFSQLDIFSDVSLTSWTSSCDMRKINFWWPFRLLKLGIFSPISVNH